jgi:internalin A
MAEPHSETTSAKVAFKEARRRIANAERNNAASLNLDKLGLTRVPPDIGRLSNLVNLTLTSNQLTSLPSQIGNLKNLESLDLYDNSLTSIPQTFENLSALTSLGLGRNRLTSIPKEVGRLPHLSGLLLHENLLTEVEPVIGQLSNLVRLDLDDNLLVNLPNWLRKHPSLRTIALHNNSQLNIPETVLGDHPELWNESNSPPELKSILDYYFGTVRPQTRLPLNEAKLILVGRGDAGKTSLVKRLVENKFSRREDTTQGIRIQQWPITVGRKKDEVRLNVWDFGGQEIMHATHQFFLTDRSLYLLVLDGRAGQQEAEADYWLRLISGFAPESPVLVVLNKIKKDHFTLNRAALKQKYPQIQDFLETDCDNPGADKKPGKKGHGIDKLHKAIAKHVNKLPDLRMAFPKSWFAVKEKLGKGQASRRKTTARRKNFLTLDEFRSVCEKFGETDPGKQDSLSVMLHRLGIALNFSDDKRLNDRHVLNPHWLTTGIYTLLNSKTLAARKGELRPKDLTKELDKRHYPADMHAFLIHLMEKFELCFGFDDPVGKGRKSAPGRKKSKPTDAEPLLDRYLIPELLDPEQPSEARDFDAKTCLNFQYDYPVLPPGLLPRFIVRTHVLSEMHRWKTGVILGCVTFFLYF